MMLFSKPLARLEQQAEAYHNSSLPLSAHDEDTDYDAPQSRIGKFIEQIRAQVRFLVHCTNRVQVTEEIRIYRSRGAIHCR